jgi:hypothetical protein
MSPARFLEEPPSLAQRQQVPHWLRLLRDLRGEGRGVSD